jgi:DNA-binding CsgD family transcriptional regulator
VPVSYWEIAPEHPVCSHHNSGDFRALKLSDFLAGTSGSGTPRAEVVDWLESGAATLFRRARNHRLTISRSGDTLLLEETRDELRLTARESQLLAWVARGKTNPEVSEILWVSPTTVRKHRENIYAKLGVHTRTAAVMRFLGVIDRE